MYANVLYILILNYLQTRALAKLVEVSCTTRNSSLPANFMSTTKQKGILKIMCQNKNISKVDVSSFSFDNAQIVKLHLSRNSISTIPPGFLSNVKGLQVVYFSWNKIEEVDANLFEDLVVLEKILLNDNKLSQINNDLFKTNINLNEIRLDNNDIGVIGKDVFKYNLKLNIVKLNMNKLKILPVGLFSNNPELSYLNLEFNEITELNPKLLSLNPNLKFLYVGENDLKIIEKDTLKNNNELEILSFKMNYISHIEDDWTHLAKLIRLDIYRNDLREFRERVFKLPSIQEMYFHRNNFKCGCDMIWTTNFTFPKFKFSGKNISRPVRKCSLEQAKEFFVNDFIVESRPNHIAAVEYLKILNCTTDTDELKNKKDKTNWMIYVLPVIGIIIIIIPLIIFYNYCNRTHPVKEDAKASKEPEEETTSGGIACIGIGTDTLSDMLSSMHT